MVQPATKGGATILLDSQLILEDALSHHPEVVKVLLKPCVTYCRDDQCTFTPVFAPISSNAWRIRWRYDFTTLIEDSALQAFELFYHKYISNPKYQKRFYLQPQEGSHRIL